MGQDGRLLHTHGKPESPTGQKTEEALSGFAKYPGSAVGKDIALGSRPSNNTLLQSPPRSLQQYFQIWDPILFVKPS